MAITQRVQMPSNIKRKKDPFETILQGLKIVSSLYGIKTGSQQQELNDLRIAQAKKQPELEEQRLAQQQQTIDQRQQQIDIQKKQSDVASESLALKKQDEQRFKLNQEILKFQREKKTQDLADAFNSAQRVEYLVDLENPIADSIAKRNLFRISGDVGVIRAEDLRELGADPSLGERAKLFIDEWLGGKRITPEARNQIREAVTVLKTLKRKELVKHGLQRSGSIAGLFRDVDKDDVYNSMNIEQALLSKVETDDEIREALQRLSLQPNQLQSQTPLPRPPEKLQPVLPGPFGGFSIMPKAEAAKPPKSKSEILKEFNMKFKGR